MVQCPELSSPTSEARPDAWLELQDPVSYTVPSVGGSPAEVGGGSGSPQGQGH